MSRKMLINATHPEEHRVAIVEDGFLTELDIEITGKEQTRGNIYKALVVRVESGLQAAFVDYGAERLGFLQIGEIHPALLPKSDSNGRSRARINEILRPGQEILVQVLKEERGTKGAALTTFLSLPGRYMVLMPESPTKGVSRKIEEEAERKKLKKAMAELDLPENMGYIVRTAGIGKPPEELRRDFDNLVKVYRGIEERSRQLKAPSLVFRESNLIIRCIRDYFTEDTEEVLVDDPTVFEEAREFFRMLMPDKLRLVKLHQERRPIFSRYQIEEQIETMAHNKVPLPSGGSIVLDATEALVAIDVNSGKMAGEQGIEATASKTNLEAAVEIARQLRLRDLAGLIVIDFIDMRDRKHIKAVEKTLRDALQKDKSRVTVGRISQFGLLEMSRQRLKPMLAAASYLECPHCQGRGRIKSSEAQGVAFLRRIQTAVAKGQIRQAEGFVPLDVADFLLNHKREELVGMEQKYDLKIILHGRAGLLPHQSDLNLVRREKEDEPREKLEIPSAEPSSLLEPAPAMEQSAASSESKEEATTPAGPETEAEEKSGKKKRRRRRRKKSTGGEVPETDAEKEADEEEAPEESAPAVEEFAIPVATVVAEPVQGSAPAAPKAKKKPRSRRRKKTESPNGATIAAAEGAVADLALSRDLDLEPSPLPAPPPEVPSDAAASPAEEQKSPARPRRSRAKKAAESQDPGENSEAASAASAVETATAKPKTARARKPAAKPLAEGPDAEPTKPAKPPKARATARKKAKPGPQAAEAEGAPVAEKAES
ncbi:Rne/Rng family ribonuclease [Geoalkalibacter sp.]|uniref:Rne/Rng family ribonuclease n=1 Tax=Geoalkalibacter sp. TaxID=3041440 RepID=UPI00272E776A|nr:Rne/Rng family ribonuclease [Geoalkalibacter sp.]